MHCQSALSQSDATPTSVLGGLSRRDWRHASHPHHHRLHRPCHRA
jgi:hypothetical protein